MHHTLGQFLKIFVNNNEDDWDVELATFSYNSMVHESTKATPFELMFGRIARTPSEIKEPVENEVTVDAYLANLITTLNKVQKIAKENIIKAKEKSKERYDQNVLQHIFKIGKSVFLLQGGKIRKLKAQYKGPFAVINNYKNGNVKIKTGKNRFSAVNGNRLQHSYIKPKFPLQ